MLQVFLSARGERGGAGVTRDRRVTGEACRSQVRSLSIKRLWAEALQALLRGEGQQGAPWSEGGMQGVWVGRVPGGPGSWERVLRSERGSDSGHGCQISWASPRGAQAVLAPVLSAETRGSESSPVTCGVPVSCSVTGPPQRWVSKRGPWLWLRGERSPSTRGRFST